MNCCMGREAARNRKPGTAGPVADLFYIEPEERAHGYVQAFNFQCSIDNVLYTKTYFEGYSVVGSLCPAH